MFLLAGGVPGLLLAGGLGQALKAMLVGVTPTDWPLYFAMTLLLAVVAVVGALVPARRAMSLDPIEALRDRVTSNHSSLITRLESLILASLNPGILESMNP